jgi:NAD(P)H dehydrogenase (quinone)
MSGQSARAARVAVIYYSATGHVHGLAKAAAQGAGDAGAEVRLRPVKELASEMAISRNHAWGRHRSDVINEPTATLDDLEWADRLPPERRPGWRYRHPAEDEWLSIRMR